MNNKKSFLITLLKSRKKHLQFFSLGILILFFTPMFAKKLYGEINTLYSNHRGDTIEFSGYKWEVKESYGKQTGPGNNYFSGSKENVYVDTLGKLHLRLTYKDDKWYCPEVRMVNIHGYGNYFFSIDSLITPLDKDIVVGLFLYDRNDSLNFHKEVDVEFSQWGHESSLNSQYVIQPKESDAHRYNTNFNKNTKHKISLRPNKIKFKSWYSEFSSDKCVLKKYSHWKVSTNKPFESENERVSVNVWLYKMIEPSNLKEFEIVISKFEFVPFILPGILNPKPRL